MHVCLFDCRTLMFSSGISVTPNTTFILRHYSFTLFQTTAKVMFLLETESDCPSNLLESGFAVNGLNGPGHGQSPAHLAACGGQAFCLLWLLQTGADANQQDASGETPIHKAARAGSLECISVLMASDAQFDICNKDGQTAEEIAWSCGFEECGRFLNMHRRNQDMKNTSSSPLAERHVLSSTLAGQKRGRASSSAQDGKKARDW